MKVAYLIPGDDAIGPNIFTLNLIKGMMEIPGFECEVFHFNRQEKYTNKLCFPVPCKALKFNEKYDFSDFDIIHSTQIYADSYVVYHNLQKKYKCITSMHCFMYPDFIQRKGTVMGWLDCQIWKYALNRLPNVIVSSSAQQRYYERHLNKKHSYDVIPYGIPEMPLGTVDKEVEKRILDFKKDYQILCGCGSLIIRKGFHQLISYLTHNPKAAVVLIGEGVEKENLQNQALDSGVSNRVLFLGFLKGSYNYYPLFDAYCLSSNSEGFGLAMLEAMCVKAPIICSDLDIYKDYFNDSNVGLFEYGNQESFNRAADRVLANKTYYSDQSRKMYDNTFALHLMAEKHYIYYNKIITQFN